MLEYLFPLLGYLNSKYPLPLDPLLRELRHEILWILLNFSSEDEDHRVTDWILKPHFHFLDHLNSCLLLPVQDEEQLQNVLWIFANLLGETDPQLTNQILTKTDILDFMCQIQGKYACLTPSMMKMIPWMCLNIIRLDPMPQVEIIQIILRVLECVVRDFHKLKSAKKRERV